MAFRRRRWSAWKAQWSLAQIETPHDVVGMNAAAGRVPSGVLGGHEHRWRSRVRLDVVDVEAQTLEAEQVLDGDEDDPRDGHFAHRPEHHDLRPGCEVHAIHATTGCRRLELVQEADAWCVRSARREAAGTDRPASTARRACSPFDEPP